MKTTTKLLSFFLVLGSLSDVSAQAIVVNGMTVVPQLPNTTSNVKIAAKITLATISAKITSSVSLNISQKTITMDDCYFMGPLQQVVSRIDTFQIGQLSAGVYTANLNALASYSQQSCATDSNSPSANSSFIFAVSIANVNGLSENEFLTGISIHPNPSSGKISIESGSGFAKPVSLTVIDITGNKIHSTNLLHANTETDLSFLTPGIYYLLLECDKSRKVFKLLRE